MGAFDAGAFDPGAFDTAEAVLPTVTDADLIEGIQLLLQEDATFSNGLWTLAEVLGYLNQRQHRFLKETQITAAWRTLGWTPHESEGPLPEDWIVTIAAAWHDFPGDVYTPLAPGDQFQVQQMLSPAEMVTTDVPLLYRDSDTPALTLGLAPAPNHAGELWLLYVALGETLDNSGVIFTVPDDFVPYLAFGVLADMLGKDGRGQDLLRARYAEARYAEGVALAHALLEGF